MRRRSVSPAGITSGTVRLASWSTSQGLGEDGRVAQHLEAVQGHQAELLRQLDRGAAAVIIIRSASTTVFAPVSTTRPRDLLRAEVVHLARGRGEVQADQPGRDPAVDLLGHRVPDVARAHARLDVGDRGPQEAADERAQHGREGVAVDDDEGPAGPSVQLAARRRRCRKACHSTRSTQPGTWAARPVAAGRAPGGSARRAGGGRGRSGWRAGRRRAGRCSRTCSRRPGRRSARISGASLMTSAVVPATMITANTDS